MINEDATKIDISTISLSRSRWPMWVLIWLFALISVTLAVRILDPTIWLGSDDASYHSAAEQIIEGQTITRMHHHYGRLSVILAVTASMIAFGNNVIAVEFPTMVLSLASVLLVVAIGRMVWGWWVGLCAGSIVAVLPYFRVLSTTIYPDVHACFWAALSTFAILHAVRSSSPKKHLFLAIVGGLTLGLAVSAKIFAGLTLIGLIGIVFYHEAISRRRQWETLIAITAGGVLFFFAHGLIYLVIADDFWFKWHTLTSAQGEEKMYTGHSNPFVVGVIKLLWERGSLFLHPKLSGWGWLAILYWPTAFFVLFTDRRGRPFAITAIVAYLLVAFFPVSLKYGYQTYPFFDGRNLLFLCVPFALCMAATTHRIFNTMISERKLQTYGPVFLAVIVAVAYIIPFELRAFRDRPTSRIGSAITKLIHEGALDHQTEIHMTASMYWRFRLLFPPEIRDCLRVSTDDNAPTWWRQTTVDIEYRQVNTSPPDHAILLATPAQFSGNTEFWDYGVGLAKKAVPVWQNAEMVATVNRNGEIYSDDNFTDQQSSEVLIVLYRNETSITNGQHETKYHLTKLSRGL